MAASSSSPARTVIGVLFVFTVIFALVFPSVEAQAPSPAPSSDGTSIDQGIAYALMLLALVLTYIIH